MAVQMRKYGLPCEPATVNRYSLRTRFEFKPTVNVPAEKLDAIRERVQQELGAICVRYAGASC